MVFFNWITNGLGWLWGNGPCFRRCQRLALLQVLAVAHEHHLSLPILLDAFSRDVVGSQRTRVRRLILQLGKTSSLGEAIHNVPGVVSPQQETAIRVGERMGVLPQGLKRLADTERDQLAGDAPTATSGYGYGLFVLWFMAMIWIFIDTKIAPTYLQIWNDFGMELPRFTIYVADFLRGGTVLRSLILLGSLALFTGAWFSGAWDLWWETGWMSPIRRLLGGKSHPEILDALHLAAENQVALPAAISCLAKYHPDRTIRSRLLLARNEVEQGADIWSSLQSARLIQSTDESILQAARRTECHQWGLHFLARTHRQHRVRRMRIVRELARPLAILALALVVGTVVIAYFLPLVQLVENLA